MQVSVIAVGKVKDRYINEGIAEYEKRLRPYADLNIVEVREERIPNRASPAEEAQVVEREGERICTVVPDNAVLVALDLRGEAWSSEDLASRLRSWEIEGAHEIAFVIGGPLGLSPAVLDRARVTLSLSRMTFLHTMVRLILLEQIYRGFRIMRGEPYHK
ncbi:23S rRNA (pseudouridine(1915)-N(3))-methyltransferase RlmH [Methanofollis fontis]|uniref:Putative ribosomal RNA large subunit methyltransferase H n=1 Tax=Methanofollis fontis TaxID=2052832 RepID=A0A483CWM4_9EURY|nr:23S rRNA (pseudouridine(1915)-N(3))-methyltransferase RlmH [Methanofollis fontis]TAJ45620.1 23S rRNA (pseudouridine(1915)-N(3))-methyltransferase RlmH [Methanofollis fontis]